jgi:hypothetical protein
MEFPKTIAADKRMPEMSVSDCFEIALISGRNCGGYMEYFNNPPHAQVIRREIGKPALIRTPATGGLPL